MPRHGVRQGAQVIRLRRVVQALLEFARVLRVAIDLVRHLAVARLGLLAILESECFTPKGSDMGFLDKLEDAFGGGKHAHFVRPRVRAKGDDSVFIVKHFAGDVTYRAEGWLGSAAGRFDHRR